MKIAYVVGTFPKVSETFIQNQITGLMDRGHEVDIFSLHRSREEVVHDQVKSYGLLERSHYLSQIPLGTDPGSNERLLESLSDSDLIHAHFAAIPASLAHEIAKIFHIPFVITCHAYDIFIRPEVKDLQEKFNAASGILTCSHYNKNYLIDLLGNAFGEKIEVVRYGIELDRFKFIDRTPRDIVTILLVGRLVEKKGILHAIRAFHKVQKRLPNVVLRIIGDGPLKDDITKLIASLRLQQKVTLLGRQPGSSVLEEMAGADIFLLPSITAANGDREGLPVSILEAQATGLPVVSTIHTGIPEFIIDQENGFLVKEGEINRLAEKLRSLVENPDLRKEMGKRGRKKVEKNHNRETELEGLENIFRKVSMAGSLRTAGKKEQMDDLKHRFKAIEQQLRDVIDNIKRRQSEIVKRNKDIARKKARLKELNTYLSFFKNGLANRVYTLIAGLVRTTIKKNTNTS
jgi:colanic acid/amylovoran biosynthesis glycosyltransferase